MADTKKYLPSFIYIIMEKGSFADERTKHRIIKLQGNETSELTAELKSNSGQDMFVWIW